MIISSDNTDFYEHSVCQCHIMTLVLNLVSNGIWFQSNCVQWYNNSVEPFSGQFKTIYIASTKQISKYKMKNRFSVLVILCTFFSFKDKTRRLSVRMIKWVWADLHQSLISFSPNIKSSFYSKIPGKILAFTKCITKKPNWLAPTFNEFEFRGTPSQHERNFFT